MSDIMHTGRKVAMERRKQMIHGKIKKPVTSASPVPEEVPEVEPIVPCASKIQMPASQPKRAGKINGQPILQGGRANSVAYRLASSNGKSAQKSFKLKGSATPSLQVLDPNASTRDIAKKVRQERCTKGKTCATVSDSSGKRRTERNSAGNSETLSGQEISGTSVGATASSVGAITGSANACKTITGTEYLGKEDFVNCSITPSPMPNKVTSSHTTKGQNISGASIGGAQNVTGDRSGQYTTVTGTYPIKEQEAICTSQYTNTNRGFSIMSPTTNTNSRITVSGNDRKSQSTTLRPNNAPTKVMPSMTARGNMTTGTQVGRVENVTGVQRGECSHITGTGYQGREEAKEICGTDIPTTAMKVASSSTIKGQMITGDRSGGGSDITGSEPGSCNAVTGTPYTAVEDSVACSASNQEEMRRRTSVMPRATGISGTTTGPSGLTGAEKGACDDITGSNYDSTAETNALCNTDAPVAGTAGRDFAPVQDRKQITGDGWDRGDKVTGIGGIWASTRNASLRGTGTTPMGSHAYRPKEQLEVPASPITGSAGNAEVGAKVTLSGGARA